MLATVPFHMGTSITSSSPFSPDIVTLNTDIGLMWTEEVCHLSGGGGDGVNGAHEDVGHNEDGHEAVEEPDQVERDPDPEGPGDLYEEGEDHPLLAALVLGPAPDRLMAGVELLGVAEVADVPGPASCQTLHGFINCQVNREY